MNLQVRPQERTWAHWDLAERATEEVSCFEGSVTLFLRALGFRVGFRVSALGV